MRKHTAPASATALQCRYLGSVPYSETWQAMRDYTDERDADSPDQCWLLQHPPVYTLGQAGKREHILEDKGIAIVNSDRGGQVTYHGPGQLIAYTLFDLHRLGIGVRSLVERLENAVIALLASYGLAATGRRDAPGVYVDGAKVAALGLRVRKGCTYHGLALNVAMDLAPFAAINPCGHPGMAVTQLLDLGVDQPLERVARGLVDAMIDEFGFINIVT